ncbi:MAG TPA: histidinol dehydrogenase [Actinomycetota bacterium]|nr:histidinol dehydrogenase [Actinomycetota bacterium]
MLELLDLRTRRERLEPRRLEIDPSVEQTVREIVVRVRRDGDEALLDLTMRFDGADLRDRGLMVAPAEFEAAERTVPTELKAAIDSLVERLTDLHRRQLPIGWVDEREGVRSGELVKPIRAAGCYVPGGRAVYPSSVAMTVVPAVVAGVEEVIVATPPSTDGSVHPSVLYAAVRSGATRVVKVGGAQAIAALAYGTGSVPAVDVVVGPGNAYVTEAKRQLHGVIGIDGLAGPSELVLIADGSADPEMLATDLVAQAEHDPQAQATFVTPDRELLDATLKELEAEVAGAGRREIVERSLREHGRAILVADLDHATEVANDLAPEHLQVVTEDPRALAVKIRSAGAIFLGPWTPVPFGDYGVASNHVLPTSGTARFTSGLRAADFVTVTSVVEMSRDAAAGLAAEVDELARVEGLVGHGRAVTIRAERAASGGAAP